MVVLTALAPGDRGRWPWPGTLRHFQKAGLLPTPRPTRMSLMSCAPHHTCTPSGGILQRDSLSFLSLSSRTTTPLAQGLPFHTLLFLQGQVQIPLLL